MISSFQVISSAACASRVIIVAGLCRRGLAGVFRYSVKVELGLKRQGAASLKK